MHCLETITKRNEEAVQKTAAKQERIIKEYIAQSPLTRPSYRRDDMRR